MSALPDAYIQEIRSNFADVVRRATPAQQGIVFHYASPEAFSGILERGEIWLSNAAYLNDPGELTYAASLAGAALKTLAHPEKRTLADLKPGRLREYVFLTELEDASDRHALFRQWYTASFSFSGNDLSQWRAYCPGGGYAVGLEIAPVAAVLEPSFAVVFGPVDYDLKSQLERTEALVIKYVEKLRDLSTKFPEVPPERITEDLSNHFEHALSRELLFLKNPAFSSEQEWRIGCHAVAVKTPRFRCGKSGLVPYVKLDLKGSDGKLPIKDVYVSPIGNQDLATHAAHLLLESKGYDRSVVRTSGYRLQ